MNIVLMGYMGCGKSSVGRVLADDMTKEYLDLDAYIERKEEMKISEIFEKKGEIYFRKKEAEHLKSCLETQNNTILSLGGGTPCFGNNVALVKSAKNSVSIYLKTGLEVLVDRLVVEKAKRPLIAHLETKESLDDFVRKHLFERSFYYNQAEHVITTDYKNVTQVAEEIKGLF